MVPPRGLQSAAHRRWSRVLNDSQVLKSRVSNAGRVLIPLSLNLSPGARGPPESTSNFLPSAGLDQFFGEFLPLGNVLQKLHRKNIEKSAKIEDFGLPKPFQNLPKMPSKSTSQKTCNFHRFLRDFLVFVARADIKKTCAHAVFC